MISAVSYVSTIVLNNKLCCVNVTFVFIISTAAPANITNVVIDLDSVIVDAGNVSFTLSWNEPFTNFDPIVNYTVTIKCTDNATCPAEFIVTTTTANVNFITNLTMMTPIQVVANNTIGQSYATTIVIIGTCVVSLYSGAYICSYISVLSMHAVYSTCMHEHS